MADFLLVFKANGSDSRLDIPYRQRRLRAQAGDVCHLCRITDDPGYKIRTADNWRILRVNNAPLAAVMRLIERDLEVEGHGCRRTKYRLKLRQLPSAAKEKLRYRDNSRSTTWDAAVSWTVLKDYIHTRAVEALIDGTPQEPADELTGSVDQDL